MNKYKMSKQMELPELFEHEKANLSEPMIEEIKASGAKTIANIQRKFKFGYRRAVRAMHVLNRE